MAQAGTQLQLSVSNCRCTGSMPLLLNCCCSTQVRFYWREDKDTTIITICDVDFEYSFECVHCMRPCSWTSPHFRPAFQCLTDSHEEFLPLCAGTWASRSGWW